MSIILRMVTLVSEMPGSLVYHLVLLAWLMVASASALSQWGRARQPAQARVALAALGLFTFQLSYFFVVILANASLFNLNALSVLPPLDRAVSALSILLLIWAFNFPDPSHPGDSFTGLLMTLIAVALGLSLMNWSATAASGAQFYYGSQQETYWEIGKLALLGMGWLLVIARRRAQWPLGLLTLATLLAGHLLHYFGLAQQNGNVPGVERLAELLALPLLTAFIFRRSQPLAASEAEMVTPAAIPVDSLEDTAPREAAPRKVAIDAKAAVALASLHAADPAEIAELITLAFAHAFKTEMCALLDAPDRSGGPQLAGAYDLAHEQFLPARFILLSEMPHIAMALKTTGFTQLTPEAHLDDLRPLARALGREPTTPALIAPLRHEDGPVLGAIILLAAHPVWTNDEQNLLGALTEAVAAVLHAHTALTQLRGDLDQAQAHSAAALAAQTRIAQLAADLAAVQAETLRLTAELEHAREESRRRQQAVDDLTQQLQTRQQAEAGQIALMGEVSELRNKLLYAQREADERGRAESELDAALERINALEVFERQLEAAQREAEEYREQERQLREELKQLRAEWAAQETEAKPKTALQTDAVPALAGDMAAQLNVAQEREQHLHLQLYQMQSELAEAQALATPYLATQAELSEAKARLTSADIELAETTAKLAAAQQQETQLRGELEQRQHELDRAQAVATNLAAAQTQEAELRQTLARLYRDLEEAHAVDATLATAQAELSETAAQLTATQTELSDAVARLTTSQTELTATAVKLSTAEERAAQTHEQLALAQAELEQLHARPADPSAPLAERLQEEVDHLRAELNHAVSQRLSHAVQLDDKTRALAALQAELFERTEELNTLRDQFEEHQRATAQVRAELDSVKTRPLPKLVSPDAPAPPQKAAASGDPEVVNSLTQELRQPMSSISGYTDLLLSESVGILGALQRKFLERIKASTERMGALLDDLIKVTVIDSGGLELAPESLDVTAAIEDAVQGCEAQFRERAVELSLDITADLPHINADRDALRQIFMHLLNNAAAVSPANSEVVLTVRREIEQGNRLATPTEYLYIAVRDAGGGIAVEDLPRVFSRLYRADAPLLTGVGDTGVGLSMVKALVEAHGGRIWVVSDPGVGSTFYALLPLERPSGQNGHGAHT